MIKGSEHYSRRGPQISNDGEDELQLSSSDGVDLSFYCEVNLHHQAWLRYNDDIMLGHPNGAGTQATKFLQKEHNFPQKCSKSDSIS